MATGRAGGICRVIRGRMGTIVLLLPPGDRDEENQKAAVQRINGEVAAVVET